MVARINKSTSGSVNFLYKKRIVSGLAQTCVLGFSQSVGFQTNISHSLGRYTNHQATGQTRWEAFPTPSEAGQNEL